MSVAAAIRQQCTHVSPRKRPEISIAEAATIAFARPCRELDLSEDSAPDNRPPALRATEVEQMQKRRTSKHRGALNEYESAWLEGDEHKWLVGLNPDDVLQALWDRAGDSENFFWKIGMHFPEPVAN
jgi:hypothetical protein